MPLVNLIELDQGESVTAMIGVRSFDKDFLVLATARGEVKKTPLSEFESVRRAGLIAMDLEPGDELVTAKQVHDDDEIVLVTSGGSSVRFSVRELRSASRQSGGVRGISLGKRDRLVSMEVVTLRSQLLTVTANGFGKRTLFEQYPRHHRGGSGVVTHEITGKTGPVVAARTVNDMQELMIISRGGIILRTRIDSIRLVGRSSQGVTLMDVGRGEAVASISCIDVDQPPTKGAKRGGKKEASKEDGGAKPVAAKAAPKKSTPKGKGKPPTGKRRTPAR
jgi:DNA gyrase subunit A